MFNQIDHLPEGLLQCQTHELHQKLGGPTLIHLTGRQTRPLFVSVLLHGNETVGWEAIKALLLKYQNKGLPRSLSLFIGNTLAAEQGRRRLPGQPDYNRVWPGSELPDCPEQRMMAQIVDEMQRRQVFASIDLHNNTGLNPHYACVNRLQSEHLHLAHLFSRTIVYFTRPKGVQSLAMSQYCPAVTLECGKVGQKKGVEHALDFVEACLHLFRHPHHEVAKHDIEVLHTVATVYIDKGIRFSFQCQPDLDLCLNDDLERLNFHQIPAGTLFGHLQKKEIMPLRVINEQGQDISADYFQIEQGELKAKQSFIPAMLTRDERVIEQDCLCYLMENYTYYNKKGLPQQPSSKI